MVEIASFSRSLIIFIEHFGVHVYDRAVLTCFREFKDRLLLRFPIGRVFESLERTVMLNVNASF